MHNFLLLVLQASAYYNSVGLARPRLCLILLCHLICNITSNDSCRLQFTSTLSMYAYFDVFWWKITFISCTTASCITVNHKLLPSKRRASGNFSFFPPPRSRTWKCSGGIPNGRRVWFHWSYFCLVAGSDSSSLADEGKNHVMCMHNTLWAAIGAKKGKVPVYSLYFKKHQVCTYKNKCSTLMF